MLLQLRAYWHVVRKCRGYRPQQVTVGSLRAWMSQFESSDRAALLGLVRHVRLVSEREVRSHLVTQYRALSTTLARAGIRPERMVFVSIDSAASSSPVALNMLRDAAHLERTGVTLVDSKDIVGLQAATQRLVSGTSSGQPYAVVYVDDFVGSGKQLLRSRDAAAQYYAGQFTEFVLSSVICEEAIATLSREGLRHFAGIVHARSERPLLPNCDYLSDQTRARLVEIARMVHSRYPLGFADMATMVILYSNAPNSTPRLLTGTYSGHRPYRGLFPMTKDLEPVWPPVSA
jgi:hypothetical protein